MPDGELRRPPQLWEQKLARTTAVVGMGVGGDATAVVTDPPTPGTDGGVEPAPVTPPVDDFVAPSTPTLSGTVQGLRVSWNGLNVNGVAYPTGTYVEIHIATSGATFTPSSSTLAGRLLGSAGFFTIGALTAGTTYWVRLVGVDEAGNRTSPSTAASSQTGLTTSSDYGTATIGAGAVSFNARSIGGITTTVGTTAPSSPVTGDIWLDSTGGSIVHKRWDGSSWVTQAWGSSSLSANCITATQIAAGAITAGAIAANAITAEKINANAITADKINASAITADKIASNAITAAKIDATAIDGKTITGSVIRTSAGASRVALADGFVDILSFYSGGSVQASMYGFSTGVAVSGNVSMLNGLEVSGNVQSDALSATATATAVPNLRAGTDGVIIKTSHVNSAQRFKQDIVSLNNHAPHGVDVGRVGDARTVDPYSVLAIAPVQFTRVADGVTRTGFIAEDVEAKFSTCVDYDEQGRIEGVDVRGIVAALLAIVNDQQQRITALEDMVKA